MIFIPQAWTGLHARAVLLISVPALELLYSGELQALLAHEIGLEKVARFNRERFGLATNENSYPPLSARRNVVKVMSNGNRALVARGEER